MSSTTAAKKMIPGRRAGKLDLVRSVPSGRADVRVSPRQPGDRLGTVKVIAASRGNGR